MRRASVAFIVALALAASPASAGASGGIEDAILALFRAARAGNDVATAQAATALVAFGPSAAATLSRSMSDRTAPELVWALRCLREIGSDAVKETVFTLCSHSDPGVRADAVSASWTLGKSASVPFLQRAASDPDDTVRRRAFDGLIEYGCQADGTLAIAVNGVVDKDFWVVLQAFQILDCQRKPERGPDRVMVELAKIVPRLDERNADACFDFFVRRAGADAGPVVEAALKSEKRCVLLSAIKAAGRLRLAAAKAEATRLAGKPDLAISVAAIDCLSLINDPDSVPILVELLDRAREPERLDALCVALRRMTGRLYGANVCCWRKYLDGRLK